VKKPEPNVDSRNQFSTVSGTIYHSEKQVTKGKRSPRLRADPRPEILENPV
jgi:hypothetical protein